MEGKVTMGFARMVKEAFVKDVYELNDKDLDDHIRFLSRAKSDSEVDDDLDTGIEPSKEEKEYADKILNEALEDAKAEKVRRQMEAKKSTRRSFPVKESERREAARLAREKIRGRK